MKKLADENVKLENNIETYENFISRMQQHYQKKKELCDELEKELKEKGTITLLSFLSFLNNSCNLCII